MPRKRNYINRLPDEVLCMVFDYLDLQSAKNASRTCRRWNNIIFFSGYVDRFVLSAFVKDLNVYPEAILSTKEMEHAIINTTMTYPEMIEKKRKEIKRNFSFHENPDKRKKGLKQLLKTITKTKRNYRNISWEVDEFMYRHFQTVWQAIHPKFTESLELFEVNFTDTPLLFVYDTLAEAIPLMPKLKVLKLKEECVDKYEQDRTLIFRNPTVETLALDFGYTSSVEMPKLISFKGALSTLHQPTGSAQPLEFERMKILTITQKGRTSTDPSVFRRMPNLDTITWDFRLGHSIFVGMCETCTSLKELCFRKQLYIRNINDLKQLHKLKDLKRLEFFDLNLDDAGDFKRFGLNFDFSKMINLKKLDLGMMVVAVSTLLSLPKSITSLGLCLYSDNDRSLVETITSHLTQLTELRLSYKRMRTSPSPEVLKCLSLLENLEVLEFSRCQFTASTFLQMDAPLHRLETMRLKQCQLETKDLLGLKQKFPILDQPEFTDCAIDTEPGGTFLRDSFSDASWSDFEAIDSNSPYSGYETDSSDYY